MKIAEGYVHSSRGEIPGPPPLNDSPGSTCINWPLYPASPTVQLPYASQKNPVIFFSNPPQKPSQTQAENSSSFWSQGNLSDSPECID